MKISHLSYLFHRSVCLFVAGSLLINLTSPAFAQSVSRRNKKINSQKLNREITRQVYVAQQDATYLPDVERQRQLAIGNRRANRGSLTDKEVSRLYEITEMFSGKPGENKKEDAFETFKEELYRQTAAEQQRQLTSIKKQAEQTRQNLQAEAQRMSDPAQYDQAAVQAWLAENLKQLNQWEKTGINNVKKWRKTQNARLKPMFNQESKKALAEAEMQVWQAIKDLFTLYNKAPLARRTLMTLGVQILPMRNMKGNSFFSNGQKQILTKLYRAEVKAGLRCETNCDAAINAVIGLGMVSSSRNDAYLIDDFIVAQRERPYSVPALLAGMGALLAMKEYGVVRGIIAKATQQEADLSDFDLLSFTTYVDAYQNKDGKYLGKVSKFATYPTTKDVSEHAPIANAWEEVALMLATEGSRDSLDILKEFGVNQCGVYVDTTITLKKEYKLACRGIVPFLAGALISGKSGASQYSPFASGLEPGTYLAGNGRGGVITAEKAAANRRLYKAKRQNFFDYVKKTGLSAEAALARHLFLQTMGDLNANSELALDAKLYKVYKRSAAKHAPNKGYAIKPYKKGSAIYNAKRVSQDSLKWWRRAAQVADVLVLLWCLWDLTKWTVKGVNMGRAMYQAMKMSRTGATVAQRAVMLRRLKVASNFRFFRNIPVRVKAGMTPVVQAQLPQFTVRPQLLKVPGEFIPDASQMVAANLKFAGEAGTLAVNAEAATYPTVFNVEQLAGANQAFDGVAQRANTAFANRSWWKRTFTFNADASYRSFLAKEIEGLSRLPGLKKYDNYFLAASVREMNIGVPKNIESFRFKPLLSGGAVDGAAVDGFLGKVLGFAPNAEQTSYVTNLLSGALEQTNLQFAHASWWQRSFRRTTRYREMFVGNLTAAMDADRRVFTNETFGKIGQSLISAIGQDKTLGVPSSLSKYAAMPFNVEKREYKTMGSSVLYSTDPSVRPVELPLDVKVETGVSGVRSGVYQRVVFTDKKPAFIFGVGNDLGTALKLNNFKVTLAADEIPAFVKAAERTGLKNPFEFKLTGVQAPGFFNSLRTSFTNRWNAAKTIYGEQGFFKSLGAFGMRQKENIYTHVIPVMQRLETGELAATPVTLRADSFLGLKNTQMVVEPSGVMRFYREGKMMETVPSFSFGVRKTEMRSFLDVVQHSPDNFRFTVKVKSSRNKMWPLYIATGLSLSSASSSLIAPLENTYGDRITETDKTMISLALPYVPSLATPLFTPFVKKIGALKTVKMALWTALGGMAFASANGFMFKVNENNLPPIWPLFVSGAAIGVSSALNRAGLNLLIDHIGGGKSLLTSMAFKNLGSFAMLVPPVLANTVMPGKTDFSLAFPVLGTLSAFSLAYLGSARIDSSIGKATNFMKFQPLPAIKNVFSVAKVGWQNTKTLFREGGADVWNSVRLLGTKELFPLALSAFAFTGFESATFNKAANQLIRPEVSSFDWIHNKVDAGNRKNTVALITSGTVIAFPLAMRLGAGRLLGWMKNPVVEGMEYQRMLRTSYALNIGGGLLMYNYGFDGFTSPGFLGIAMVGLGTANVTQSLQKLANYNVVHGAYVASKINRFATTAAEAEAIRRDVATTAMTVFSTSQLGLATVPMLVSGYTDGHIREGIEERKDVARTSLWIPLASIGASAALSARFIGWMPKRLPLGSFGFSKGILGSYPQSFDNATNLFTPGQPFAPYGTPRWYTPAPAITPFPAPIGK